MAGPLAAIERFFERLLERPAARLFQARLEPVHVQRQLERAMEAERRLASRRTYVPSSYSVMLNPTDLASFESYRDSLANDLSEALHAHARNRGYTLTARPRVAFEASSDVSVGDVVVRAQPIPPPRDRRGAIDRVVGDSGKLPAPSADASPAPAPRSDVAEAAQQAARTPAAAPPAAGAQGPATSHYAIPQTHIPKAVLAVRVPGRPVLRVPVRTGTVHVGRANDNDLVLADELVSRHHGRFSVRLGTLVYSDLNSTNGSFLNGSRVTEIALGPGDVLQLGSSTLAVEQGD